MAQGEFTKQEAEETVRSVQEMFDALPKTRKYDYIGHLNDIFLFIEAAERAAPNKAEVIEEKVAAQIFTASPVENVSDAS